MMDKNTKILVGAVIAVIAIIWIVAVLGPSEETKTVEMINGGSSYFWHPETSEFELWQYLYPSDNNFDYEKLIVEFRFYDSNNQLLGSENVTLENTDLHKSVYIKTNLPEEAKTWDFKVIESIPL